jgi:formylglycine-generating enzyme required for sulfatase activity
MKIVFLCVLCALCTKQSFAGDDAFARIPGATFASVLPVAKDNKDVTIPAYQLARTPVTNAEFLEFVKANPRWLRGRAAKLFVDDGYLKHWAGPAQLGAAEAAQPVVHVSWFAADAYCAAQGARLPTWHEWEWAAAADERVADARKDPVWRQRMLDWYAETGTVLPRTGRGPANVHGVQDLHGLVWEWVEDFGGMMVSGDNREQGTDPDLMKFCGAGAMTMEQKENYAVMMRIAMLSSLKASYTTANLGFRCAKDLP